jgi:hypothetical protein
MRRILSNFTFVKNGETFESPILKNGKSVLLWIFAQCISVSAFLKNKLSALNLRMRRTMGRGSTLSGYLSERLPAPWTRIDINGKSAS